MKRAGGLLCSNRICGAEAQIGLRYRPGGTAKKYYGPAAEDSADDSAKLAKAPVTHENCRIYSISFMLCVRGAVQRRLRRRRDRKACCLFGRRIYAGRHKVSLCLIN
jgi:hypothetical protein